jgi:hypothetical protein
VTTSPTAAEALGWAAEHDLLGRIDAAVAEAPPLPPRAVQLLEAAAVWALRTPSSGDTKTVND